MIYITNRVKLVIGIAGAFIIVDGLVTEQYFLSQRIKNVEETVFIAPKVIVVTATPEPTATPSAVVKYKYAPIKISPTIAIKK